MSNGHKVAIIVLCLFLYLFMRIVHDRTMLEYGKLRREEIKLSKVRETYKSKRDSLITYQRIVGIAKSNLNMIFPKGNQKKVIE